MRQIIKKKLKPFN